MLGGLTDGSEMTKQGCAGRMGGLAFDAFDERGGFIVDDACLAAVEAVAARGIRDVVEARSDLLRAARHSPRGSVSITSGAMRP